MMKHSTECLRKSERNTFRMHCIHKCVSTRSRLCSLKTTLLHSLKLAFAKPNQTFVLEKSSGTCDVNVSVSPVWNDGNNDDDINSLAVDNCAICLEKFKKGDKVCSSYNKQCYHLFHHVCIQIWLLKHKECPCCRQNYLCVDRNDREDDDVESGRARPETA